MPELTRRLGELPGFTAERIERWLETYPAADLYIRFPAKASLGRDVSLGASCTTIGHTTRMPAVGRIKPRLPIAVRPLTPAEASAIRAP